MSEVRVQETGDPSASLQIEDLAAGSGEAATRGRQVEVRYTCWLYDPQVEDRKGRKLDGTDDHGVSFAFRVGSGQVIRGWDAGVEGMRVGGKRRLVVPPALGYGAHGAAGVIPPGATLLFEIELIETHP
jgi:FKBP-type peptidyl-prolyl cis-trans isomerase